MATGFRVSLRRQECSKIESKGQLLKKPERGLLVGGFCEDSSSAKSSEVASVYQTAT